MSRIIFKICFSRSFSPSRATKHIFWKFYSPADILWSPKTLGRVLGYTTDFLTFYHPNNPENQHFEKTKKTPGDIIILHKSTTNDNHTYGS